MKESTDKRLSKRKMLLLCAAFVLALIALYMGGRWLENFHAAPETRGDLTMRESVLPSIEHDGVRYRPKQGVTTILLMGIDHNSDEERGGTRQGGQADFLQLIVMDRKAKEVRRLKIDRDTMTPITVLGVLGTRSGVRTAQVSLSHGFGDGGKQSCELTCEAVSNLLMNIDIDYYMAMEMDGISALNDMAGGVTVTLEDDFSAIDATMPKGATITLKGEQAEIYVRSRRSIGVGTNESRMARQETYISLLLDKIQDRINGNRSWIERCYDAMTPYLTTNMSKGRLINDAWAAKDYDHSAVYSIEGKHEVSDDGFMQFHADEASLWKAVLAMLYDPVV